MPPTDDPPHPLSYRSAQSRQPPPAVVRRQVAAGFLCAFAAEPVLAGVRMAGTGRDGMVWSAVVMATTIGAVGVGRGLARRGWGFLIGAGLFAASVGPWSLILAWAAVR